MHTEIYFKVENGSSGSRSQKKVHDSDPTHRTLDLNPTPICWIQNFEDSKSSDLDQVQDLLSFLVADLIFD